MRQIEIVDNSCEVSRGQFAQCVVQSAMDGEQANITNRRLREMRRDACTSLQTVAGRYHDRAAQRALDYHFAVYDSDIDRNFEGSLEDFEDWDDSQAFVLLALRENMQRPVMKLEVPKCTDW